MTYDEIFERVLRRIPNHLDKREGSVIWYAVASTVAELVQLSHEIEYVKSQFILENVSGEELTKRVKDNANIDRLKATNAILKAKLDSNSVVEDGTRFIYEDLTYVVIEHINDVYYKLKCEQSGDIGNSHIGRIIPVGGVPGLRSSEIIEIIQHGYNEESDESLLSRYYEHLRLPATSGNESHYIIWAKEVAGVGEVRVVPTWNGPGTVKVIITDENMNTANKDLIDKTYEHIESVRPVGADVTVESAEYVNVKVTANVVVADGYTLESIKESFIKKINVYRRQVAFKESYVSYAKVGSLLMETDGVLDYDNLKLNDDIQNIELEHNNIPLFDVELIEHEL